MNKNRTQNIWTTVIVVTIASVLIPAIVTLLLKPDPMSAKVLVKTHPELQKICDLAGGCNKIKIECEKYDNTGNTILRGETVWSIDTDSENDKVGYINGTGFSSTSPHPLDTAIADWLLLYHAEYDPQPDGNVINKIYPNSKKCDDTCIQ